MNNKKKLDEFIQKEKKNPTIFGHYINSYMSNLEVDPNNKELVDIVHYFSSPEDFLPLYQNIEFKNGLTIEVRCEMIDEKDKSIGITRRESLFHNHDFFEIIYVYKGVCETIIDKDSISLSEGQICLFNLQAVHKLIIPNEEAVVFNILIGKELLNDTFLYLFKNTSFVTSFFLHSIYSIPSIKPYSIVPLNDSCSFYLQKLILEFVDKKSLYTQLMQSNFTSLLLEITRIIEEESNNETQSNNEIEIDKILNYINENYQTVTLNDLADHFGYSNRTMIRYLKKYTQSTFSTILRECKLTNALNLLLHTEYSIDQIAEMTGFSDRSYFDKVFKENYKISANLYRKKYQIK